MTTKRTIAVTTTVAILLASLMISYSTPASAQSDCQERGGTEYGDNRICGVGFTQTNIIEDCHSNQILITNSKEHLVTYEDQLLGCVLPLEPIPNPNDYKNSCINQTEVQTAPDARNKQVGQFFAVLTTQDTGETAYELRKITDSVEGFDADNNPCSFDCIDGFDASCDNRIGDFCPIELKVDDPKLRQVENVRQCLTTLANQQTDQVKGKVVTNVSNTTLAETAAKAPTPSFTG